MERTQFTGAIPFEDVPAYFQELDVLVIPTETTKRIWEQFGRVIVEAMATGVPVIGSTCGAIPEVIADAGLVFPEGDAGALAAALRRMLTDHELRRSFARAGRPHVEQNFSSSVWLRKRTTCTSTYCRPERTRPSNRIWNSLPDESFVLGLNAETQYQTCL